MDRVTWDPDKDRLNQAKHGISFAEVRLVLAHPLTRRWPDVAHSEDEARTIAWGLESPAAQGRSAVPERPSAPSFPDTVAYWLEDERAVRVTKLYRTADKPMMFAGRALEHLGHLDGWAIVRCDLAGTRHVVASSADLAGPSHPFMPQRTPGEAAALAPLFEALRAITGRRDPDPEVTDERVY